MAIINAQKLTYLDKAIEIAKAAASSGGPGGCSKETLVGIIEETYGKMIKIAENITP